MATKAPPHKADHHMAAHYTYYQLCQGRWRATLELEITDSHALRRAHALADWLAIYCLAHWPRLLGRPKLETSVDCLDHTTVLHTTALTWWSLPLLTSRETLTLHDDAHSFTLHGNQRTLLTPWATSTIEGRGHIDAQSAQGDYRMTFFGAPLHQSTQRCGDQVTLTMTGQGYRAYAPLAHLGPR